MKFNSLTAGIVSVLLASSASAMVVNGDFSDGINGWDSIGNSGTIFGTGYGLTYGSGADADDIENFLGLGSGSLSAVSTSGNPVTNGSALAQTISVEAGDVLTFDFAFFTYEDAGEDEYTDFAFLSVASAGGDDVSNIANTESPSLMDLYFSATTGIESYSYTFADAGDFILGFGVVNVEDDEVNSGLALDNVALNGGTSTTAAVPEPSTVGLLAIGLVGLGLARKRLR